MILHKVKKFIGCSMIFALSLAMTGCTQTQKTVQLDPVQLEYWGVQEREAALGPIIEKYNEKFPHVQITYTQVEESDYVDELLHAFAEGRGPDIFSLDYLYLENFKNKLVPAPNEYTIVGLSDENIPTQIQKKGPSLRRFQNDYIDIAFKKSVLNYSPGVTDLGEPLPEQERVFGIPLYVDTLALYYNIDIYTAKGIEQPPRTWQQFQETVQEITSKNSSGTILQSAAAIGTAKNVTYDFELLSLIMMQNGAPLYTERTNTIGLNEYSEFNDTEGLSPGAEGLQFYTTFGSDITTNYTWDTYYGPDIDAFAQGKTAMYFGFASDYLALKEKSPRLNFNVTQIPQIGGNPVVNYPRFEVEVVSAQSQFADYGWDFLTFLAEHENSKEFLQKMKLPSGKRTVIPEQKNDPILPVFTSQVLTARDWYPGEDRKPIENIFAQMIEDALLGKYDDITEITSRAQNQIVFEANQ